MRIHSALFPHFSLLGVSQSSFLYSYIIMLFIWILRVNAFKCIDFVSFSEMFKTYSVIILFNLKTVVCDLSCILNIICSYSNNSVHLVSV